MDSGVISALSAAVMGAEKRAGSERPSATDGKSKGKGKGTDKSDNKGKGKETRTSPTGEPSIRGVELRVR